MTSGHRIPQNADDWMRDLERRLTHLERRPAVSTAAEILGPAIGPQARQVLDWNSDEACFNGWLWSDETALNVPSLGIWIGMVITTSAGHGIQQVWSHEHSGFPTPVHYIRTYHRHDPHEVAEFGTWALA
jgi:hypothetical protein